MAIRLIGLDPGLRRTDWGGIEVEGNSLAHVASGAVTSTASLPLSERLFQLFDALTGIFDLHAPAEAAVEETFVNKNPASTLKLGQARGAVMLADADVDLIVFHCTAASMFAPGFDDGIIDRIEILSPTDAQFQFGTAAGNGAVLIYTR